MTVGQTVSVVLAANPITNTAAGSADVTLTASKEAVAVPEPASGTTATADPGTQYVCLEFKVKNTGQADLDTYPFTLARWTGQDGLTKNAQLALGVDCQAFGMTQSNLNSEPKPQPGQFVIGTTLLSVPNTEPGVLEFEDRSQAPMFTVATTPVS